MLLPLEHTDVLRSHFQFAGVAPEEIQSSGNIRWWSSSSRPTNLHLADRKLNYVCGDRKCINSNACHKVREYVITIPSLACASRITLPWSVTSPLGQNPQETLHA